MGFIEKEHKIGRYIKWQPHEDEEIKKASPQIALSWILDKRNRDFNVDLIHRLIFVAQEWEKKIYGNFFGNKIFSNQLSSMVVGYLSNKPSHPFIEMFLNDEDKRIDPTVGWKNLHVGGYRPVLVNDPYPKSTIWLAGENELLFSAINYKVIDLVVRLLSHEKVQYTLKTQPQQERLRETLFKLEEKALISLVTCLAERSLLKTMCIDEFTLLNILFTKGFEDEDVLTSFLKLDVLYKEFQEINSIDSADLYDIRKQMEDFKHYETNQLTKQTVSERMNLFKQQQYFDVDKIIFNLVEKKYFKISFYWDKVELQQTKQFKLFVELVIKDLIKDLFFHYLKAEANKVGLETKNMKLEKTLCLLVFTENLEIVEYFLDLFDVSQTIEKCSLAGESKQPTAYFSKRQRNMHPLYTSVELKNKKLTQYLVTQFPQLKQVLETFVSL